MISTQTLSEVLVLLSDLNLKGESDASTDYFFSCAFSRYSCHRFRAIRLCLMFRQVTSRA